MMKARIDKIIKIKVSPFYQSFLYLFIVFRMKQIKQKEFWSGVDCQRYNA